jgi:hypothetical protein
LIDTAPARYGITLGSNPVLEFSNNLRRLGTDIQYRVNILARQAA